MKLTLHPKSERTSAVKPINIINFALGSRLHSLAYTKPRACYLGAQRFRFAQVQSQCMPWMAVGHVKPPAKLKRQNRGSGLRQARSCSCGLNPQAVHHLTPIGWMNVASAVEWLLNEPENIQWWNAVPTRTSPQACKSLALCIRKDAGSIPAASSISFNRTERAMWCPPGMPDRCENKTLNIVSRCSNQPVRPISRVRAWRESMAGWFYHRFSQPAYFFQFVSMVYGARPRLARKGQVQILRLTPDTHIKQGVASNRGPQSRVKAVFGVSSGVSERSVLRLFDAVTSMTDDSRRQQDVMPRPSCYPAIFPHHPTKLNRGLNYSLGSTPSDGSSLLAMPSGGYYFLHDR